jgi:hypothetical protein
MDLFGSIWHHVRQYTKNLVLVLCILSLEKEPRMLCAMASFNCIEKLLSALTKRVHNLTLWKSHIHRLCLQICYLLSSCHFHGSIQWSDRFMHLPSFLRVFKRFLTVETLLHHPHYPYPSQPKCPRCLISITVSTFGNSKYQMLVSAMRPKGVFWTGVSLFVVNSCLHPTTTQKG